MNYGIVNIGVRIDVFINFCINIRVSYVIFEVIYRNMGSLFHLNVMYLSVRLPDFEYASSSDIK